MSKKKLLLNLLALSCLTNSGVGALEKKNIKNSTPSQKITKSVSNKDENKSENKIEKTDNFFIKNKSEIISGGAGLALGGILGSAITGLAVNHFKNASLNEQLQAKQNTITGLQNQVQTLQGQVSNGDAELKKQIGDLTKEKDELTKKLQQKDIELITKNTELNNKDDEIKGLKEHNALLANSKDGMKDLNDKLSKLNEEIVKLKKEKTELETLKNKIINDLNQKLNAKNEGEGGFKVGLNPEAMQKERDEALKNLKEEKNKLNELTQKFNLLESTIKATLGDDYKKEDVGNLLGLGKILKDAMGKVGNWIVQNSFKGELTCPEDWRGWIKIKNANTGNKCKIYNYDVGLSDMVKRGIYKKGSFADKNDMIDTIKNVAALDPEGMIKLINFAVRLTNALENAANNGKYGVTLAQE